MQCRRNGKRSRRNRCGCASPVSVARSPGLKHRLCQLLNEERHAVCALDDLLHDLSRERRRAADQPKNQRAALFPSQAAQSQRCHVRLAGPGRLKLGPEGGDQQHGKALDLLSGEIKQLAGAWVSPMQILKDHQYGMLASQTGELPQQGLERFLLLPLRREVESRIASVERQ
jgi:hypothetical protein